jgi:NADH/NAD ratio-sensing transcriptional regulator Rex
MVSYYYIICRSLTYAQRTATTLQKAGILGTVLRAPKAVATSGCSYAVRISANQLSQSLKKLNQAGLAPLRVYLGEADGEFREVSL